MVKCDMTMHTKASESVAHLLLNELYLLILIGLAALDHHSGVVIGREFFAPLLCESGRKLNMF